MPGTRPRRVPEEAGKRSRLGAEDARQDHGELRGRRPGGERGRRAGGGGEGGSRGSETRPGEGRGAAAAPGPRVPWPAVSMFRRRPGCCRCRGRDGGRGRSRDRRSGSRSPRTQQPEEQPQPPRRYVISEATANFRFDAGSAFVPPPGALSNQGVVRPSPRSSAPS